MSDSLPGGAAEKSIVDREITCDRRGLPLIPSRRIRGILREAAEELEYLGVLDEGFAADLFGRPGESGSHFIISDGRIENAGQYKAFLDEVAKKCPYFSVNDVLDYFSYLRAQTAIDSKTGAAKKDSLRVSRVLKKGVTAFYFDVEFPDDAYQGLKDSCTAVEAFGQSRTRGLGQIVLSLEKADVTEPKYETDHISKVGESKDVYAMQVTVESLGSLLMSDGPSGCGENCGYIPGAVVLGAFASLYMRKNCKNSNECNGNDDFGRLFLTGETQWTPLYPSDDGKTCYYPAPVSYRIYKYDSNSNSCVDLSVSDAPDDESLTGCGGRCFWDDGKAACVAQMGVGYHHRRAEDRAFAFGRERGGKTEDGGVFFQYETIEPEQFFTGAVRGYAADLETIQKLLPQDGKLRLGRSRNSQYGDCCVTLGNIEPVCLPDDVGYWKKDDWIRFTLLSDTVLLNEAGLAEPSAEQLKKEIARVCGVPDGQLSYDDDGNDENKAFGTVFLKKKLLGGYLGVWDLPKPQRAALAAGSVICLKNTGDTIEFDRLKGAALGSGTAQGMGQFVWQNRDDCYNDVFEFEDKKRENASEMSLSKLEKEESIRSFVNTVLRKAFERELKAAAAKDAEDFYKEDKKLSGAQLGRFLLVWNDPCIKTKKDLEDSLKKFKGDNEDKPAYKNLRDHLSKKLYIKFKKDENYTEYLEFDEDDFKKFVESDVESDMRKKLYALTNNGFTDPLAPPTFEDYRRYACAFLTQLKYCNRKGGDDK